MPYIYMIQMTYLQDKINTFFKKRNEIFKNPLEKIINIMLNKCKYINGESLERHNWGNNPIKLKNIPKNINLPSFEEELLNALNLEDNEKSIVELLWGDIQLGKRVQACIIMWISVHILKRPVLYIFRNLSIDQKQLQDDIIGTENYNFNIQFIKTLFQEFNNELQEYFEETNVEYWKDYKLPELKDINSNDIISKLSNKEAINSNDIFCCLMNHTQLAKLNTKFSEYIYYNDELVALMTFGKLRNVLGNKNKNIGEFELLRFCNKINTIVIGGASKLLKHFNLKHQPNKIITFANKRYSNGNLYGVLGFVLDKTTQPNYWYVVGKKRKHRFSFRKDILVKEGYDPNKTEHQIMQERKIPRIYDCGNIKYIKI